MTAPDPSTTDLVSILLVTHNHADYIDTALASIAAQATTFPIEVVVADDASTDATLEHIEHWASTVELDVRILPPENRLGITLNYHRGLTACRGRFIAVLEGDDEWISVDKVQEQATALVQRPDASMVANRVLLYDHSTSAGTVIPLIGFDQFSTTITATQLAAVNWFATFSCCMYRADVVRLLPPALFELTAYDWLLNMAMMEHGDAVFLPQVMTLYRTHSSGQWSSKSQAEREMQIRDLLPGYIDLLGPELKAELTRVRHDLERRLRDSAPSRAAAVELNEPQPTDETAPPAVHPAVPRVSIARRPRVSVVMTCYNHGRFVVEAVNSVLDQTMGDLELIIVDDASSDDSIARIATLRDERMRVFALATNQGAAAALNLAIQQTRGELVAVINSDDAWEPSKLERQLTVMAERPELGAVFTGARFVGEAGEAIAPEKIPTWNDVFRQPRRNQAQWLRYFFAHGNALCHPSVLIRREFYELHGLYDNRLRQLPDLERWVCLVKHYPIAVLGDEDLVRFRLLAAEQNASSGSQANVARSVYEHLAVDEHFFDGCSDELLIEAFLDLLADPIIRTPEERECAIAFLWWDAPSPLVGLNRIEALRRFRLLLGNSETALLLRSRYGMTELTFHEMSTHEAYLRAGDLVQQIWNDSVSRSTTNALLTTVFQRVKAVHPSLWPRRVTHHLSVLRNNRRG